MGKVRQIKAHTRKVRGKEVRVRAYTATYKEGQQGLTDQQTMEVLFDYGGEGLLHAMSAYTKEEQFGRAMLMGMSTTEGYERMLQRVNTELGRQAIRRLDAYIGRYGVTSCRGLKSGVPMDKSTFEKLSVGSPVSIGNKLPIYTSPKESVAVTFAHQGKPGNVPCVFEVEGGNAKGHSGHHSKHEGEQEVVFRSDTQVRVTSRPIVINKGQEDEFYLIRCTMNKKK